MEELIVIAQIVRAAFSKVYGNDLCGFCCRASVQLFLRAKERGIADAKLGAAWAHVFVVFGDQIVDITATQFGFVETVAMLPLNMKKRQIKLNKVNGFAATYPGIDPWSPHKLVDSIRELTTLGWRGEYHLEEDSELVSRNGTLAHIKRDA